MIRIDRELLLEIGLGHLDPEQQQVIRRRIYRVLEMRVGVALGSSLTSGQLDTFERLINDDYQSAYEYLARTIPNYGILVRRELAYVARAIAQSIHEGEVMIAGIDPEEASNA